MGYMRKFYENERFWTLKPVESIETDIVFADENLFGLFAPMVTSNEDMSHIIIYYGAATRGSCTLSGMKKPSTPLGGLIPGMVNTSKLTASLYLRTVNGKLLIDLQQMTGFSQ